MDNDLEPAPTPGRRRPWATAAVVYLLADLFVSRMPSPVYGGLHWNWFGKGYEVALSGGLLIGSGWARRNAGLRWRQAAGSVRWSVAAAAVSAAYGYGFAARTATGPRNVETLLFQAVLPTLSEELAFRGIALALLEQAFGHDPIGGRLRFGWASVVVTALFGLAHGLSFGPAGVHLQVGTVTATAALGGLFALVRTRSASLVWPMVCHSVANVTLVGLPMVW